MKTGRLTQIVEQSMNVSRETFRNYIGASSIGSECLRKVWYEYRGVEGAPVSNKLQRTFNVGKRLETLVTDALIDSGMKLITPCAQNHHLKYFDDDFPFFQGHCDAIWSDEDAVIEIKTARDSSFKIFVNKGLEKWSPAYYAQVQAYMGMSGLKTAYLICLNKDTSELHDEKVEFNPEYYDCLKARAVLVHDADEPLNRVNRSPYFITCRTCKFRDVCHEGGKDVK